MKKLLFVQSRPPHGSINGQEGLDALLAGSAFAACELLLLDDGVFQILAGQNTAELGDKDYSVSYGALADYGVETIYVSERQVKARGLDTDDLIVPVVALSDTEVGELLANADVILNF